jgi:hypothetical protein
MSEVWYHIVKQAEDDDAATLWMVRRDESGYTCRVWQLSAFDCRKLEAWTRMIELRKSSGLSLPPLPDISDRSPIEAHFAKIHEARAYLGTTWDQTLQWHAAEFFRQIDPVRYPNVVGNRGAQ